ncbi:hypothetical protein [uncultured Tateyamaria sp.]|nr:hypothetical protein [uncultured Tateyamaria sp.]
MLNIYAHTFMTASRNRRCTPVEIKGRRWWHPTTRKCIDLSKL